MTVSTTPKLSTRVSGTRSDVDKFDADQSDLDPSITPELGDGEDTSHGFKSRVRSPKPCGTPPLVGASLKEIEAWVVDQGQPKYRGKQIYQWIYERGVRSLGDISVLPKAWRQTVEASGVDVVGRSPIHYRSDAPDGTIKLLLQMPDGNIVETVGIPTDKRLTVCVSSQVGCPMACDFCATGKGGWQRNLSRGEIVEQVLAVREVFDRRVSNIVFMGMGEPLLNSSAVLGAVRSLNEDLGIGQRNITVSTVGVPGQIHRLAQAKLQATLAVSLHASNQKIRQQLVPTAKRYPIGALLDDCRDYVRETRRRVTFEYILLAGVNDTVESARELAGLLRGFQSHVNLIPYNPINEADYQCPSSRRIDQFVRTLRDRRVAVSVRRARGLESDAACGQLRASRAKVTTG
ncbi:MAG: 23S rRNA (adenine(2503)-C(2))-methyltransferase RlmN [Cyanobacteria bacterium P01_D01_bin.73]